MADGKSLTRPLMAAALPKSRFTSKAVLNVHGYQLNTFLEPIFRCGKKLTFYQKTLLDNLM